MSNDTQPNPHPVEGVEAMAEQWAEKNDVPFHAGRYAKEGFIAGHQSVQPDVKVLADALKWYADPGNYVYNNILATVYQNGKVGDIAKEALSQFSHTVEQGEQQDELWDEALGALKGYLDNPRERMNDLHHMNPNLYFEEELTRLKQYYHITKRQQP